MGGGDTRFIVALALLASGCEIKFDNGDSSGDGPPGNPSGDANMANVDCDNVPDPPVWSADTCIADTLSCGDTVRAVNTGGPTQLQGSEYASFWACAVVGEQSYSGNEQHFFFTHPGNGDVTVGLDSPCEDLDLFVIRWDGGSCVREGLSIIECDGAVGSGGGSVTIWNNEAVGYVIVVDGPKGEEGPYAVSLTCP